MTNKLILYTVIPCYNEQEVLPQTIGELSELYKQWIMEGLISSSSRMLFVDDGSKDHTKEIIRNANKKISMVGGVFLSGNVGHQNALMAGLSSAADKADVIVTIDADLQDNPAVIADMLNEYHNGADIVYGVRKERKTDTFFKRKTAEFFYLLMKYLGTKTVYNHADYRLMSQRAVRQLLQYRERNLFLRGIVPLIGYRTAKVYYNREERHAGESKYPISKMVNFAIDGITSFSVKPVHMVFVIGVFFIMVSLLILLYVLYSIFVTKSNVSGWASLILSVWFIGGAILMCLGIVGEYIGKIYTEVKDRPRFNIQEII